MIFNSIVGIDVGKTFHQTTVLNEKAESVGGTLQFQNSASGYIQFLNHLKRLNVSPEQALIALEATGHYWLSIYLFLIDKGFNVQVFNPYQSDALRKVYLGRAKTDKLDAELVARLARLGNQQPTKLPGSNLLSLRNLCRFRSELVFQTGDVKRRIIAILDLIFPEFEKLFSTVFGKTALAILENHPTPDELLNLSEDKLIELISSSSHGRFAKKQALKLKETAKNSIGISICTDALVFELKTLLEQLKFLKYQLENLDEKISSIFSTIDQKLTTIPGIGMISAATIIGEIGDIKRFPNIASVVAYAGFDPTVSESGTSINHKRKMSKKGSKYLRTVIWQSAVHSLVHNSLLKNYYDMKRSEGKPKQVAIGAVANKLTRIIYGILRSGQPYEVHQN